MSLSQFFVISPRGDTIISRDFRGDINRKTAEIFYRNARNYQGRRVAAPPIFHLDGVNYFYLKNSGLWFVATTKQNIAPSMVAELLFRITRVFKDYCGVINEESIRKNFTLVYELLDEVLDYGYIQGTSSELLKAYVYNTPIVQSQKLLDKLKMDMNAKTTSAKSVDKPIDIGRGRSGKQKNEIFVDIYELISVTFNANVSALSSSIDGSIQMKSYLSGNPELRLALNDDLQIAKPSAQKQAGPNYGQTFVDDMNFHECVKMDEWEQHRTLHFFPPDGEFSVLNYRISGEFRQPFRIFPFFELSSPFKVELILKIRADIPEQNYGGNVLVTLPVPKSARTVNPELNMGVLAQSSEYDQDTRRVYWRIKKFQGGTEQALRVKITLSEKHTAAIRKEIGPISMKFEIPMYNVSNLQVRYLRIMESQKSYNPYRWVRYVTRGQSYICRL